MERWPYQNEEGSDSKDDKDKTKEGIRTLYQAFTRNLFHRPKVPLYLKIKEETVKDKIVKKVTGTTFQKLADQAEHLSYGLVSEGLLSDPIDFEGREVKTIAILCSERGNVFERIL